MISDNSIDNILLSNITDEWRKMSFVVGHSMLQIDKGDRFGLDDLYFAGRLRRLCYVGRIESTGDMENLRECEIRIAK